MKIGYIFFDETLFSENPVFVEVGSISGKFGNFVKNLGQIIIYEPSKINFEKLKNNISDATLWNKGVGSFNGEVMFYDYESITSASIFKKQKKVINQYPIDIVNLETIFAENNIKKIDLLVLSCEGCELDVLNDVHRFDVKQICVNVCARIYGNRIRSQLIRRMEKRYTVIKGEDKWTFYLMIKK